jgi:hypothetical protein
VCGLKFALKCIRTAELKLSLKTAIKNSELQFGQIVRMGRKSKMLKLYISAFFHINIIKVIRYRRDVKGTVLRDFLSPVFLSNNFSLSK